MADLGTGDVVEIDAANILAMARIRHVEASGRLYVALEPGMFLPWVPEVVRIRRCIDDVTYDARLIHCAGVTATLDVLGISTFHVPEPPDTERDFDRY